MKEPSLTTPPAPATGRPRLSGSARWLRLFLGVSLLGGPLLAGSPAAPEPILTAPLSLPDAVNLAFSRNATVLRARKDLESTEGLIVQTRAIAVPKLVVSGNFKAVQPSDIDIVSFPAGSGLPTGLTFGVDKTWATGVELVQSLYEGGRIASSFRTARLSRAQALLNYQTALSDVILLVELAYYDVLLAQQQITVREASVDLLTHELADTTRRYDAGTVPRFNVLRAEVELANARPKLIRARNSFRIAKNNLVNLMGFNLPRETSEDIPLTLAGKLEAQPYTISLPDALQAALGRRTELQALRKAQALRNEDVITAKAGSKPSVQAYAGYEVHNSALHADVGYEIHGWVAGVGLNWNVFDGMATRGRVRQALAGLDRAAIDLDDTARRIELEVRTAFSNFIEAGEVNESEKKVIEQAEEALRLARSRYEAGAGTQLDVLSAQTALTDARTTSVEALHDYSAARARLERATGALTAGAAGTPPSQ